MIGRGLRVALAVSLIACTPVAFLNATTLRLMYVEFPVP